MTCAYCGERPAVHIDREGRAECQHCANLPEPDSLELAAFLIDRAIFLSLTVQ
jgi:sarcosine oxidase delta subunit